MSKFIEKLEDGGVRVTLRDGETIIDLREPTVLDRKLAVKAESQPEAQEAHLLASISMLSPEELGEISLGNSMRLQEGFAEMAFPPEHRSSYVKYRDNYAEVTLASGQTMTMREPKYSDRQSATAKGGTEKEKEDRLIARVCELGGKSLDEMSLGDFARLQQALAGFLD